MKDFEFNSTLSEWTAFGGTAFGGTAFCSAATRFPRAAVAGGACPNRRGGVGSIGLAAAPGS
jgi:hypothetical protein